MVCCGFIFDMIVVRVDVPSAHIENNRQLRVLADFNNKKLKITPSRINVVEFKPRRSFEFEISPDELRKGLLENPLKLTLYYNSEVIGVATIPWNDAILASIQKNMGELTHIDNCELASEDSPNERVGVLEYVWRLQCKCEESSEECKDVTDCDLKRHVSKIIDPHDVLFVIAEPTKMYDCDVPLSSDPKPTCGCGTQPDVGFDLSPYRFLNGQTVHSSDAINLCHNLDCCELRSTLDPCQCLYDVYEGSKKEKCLSSCKSKSSNKLSCGACQEIPNISNCQHTNKSTMSLVDLTMEEFAHSKNHPYCNMTADEILNEFYKKKREHKK